MRTGREGLDGGRLNDETEVYHRACAGGVPGAQSLGAELVRAARKIATLVRNGTIKEEEITEQTISDHLYTCGQPDVDLLIRTSGEQRLSNFMLYQNAYAEFIFPTVLWPDFTVHDYDMALDAFAHRERRNGGR